LAVIAAEKCPEMKFQLVESDARKCAFMRNVAREVGISPDIHTQRIEVADIPKAELLTARALASLSKLLGFTPNLLLENGVCLFLKGQGYATELESARESWIFEAQSIPSQTHPSGVLAKISGIKHGG